MELPANEVGERRGRFELRLLGRVAGHIVVVVAGEVAEGFVDVGEVQLADFHSGPVELGGDDFVVTAYSAEFEAGAVVFVFGEPFGVSLHDVVEDSEGFACRGVYCFHVVMGVWSYNCEILTIEERLSIMRRTLFIAAFSVLASILRVYRGVLLIGFPRITISNIFIFAFISLLWVGLVWVPFPYAKVTLYIETTKDI